MTELRRWSLYELRTVDAPFRFAKVLRIDHDVTIRPFVTPPRVLWSGDDYPRLVVDCSRYDRKSFAALFPHEESREVEPDCVDDTSEDPELRVVPRDEFESWQPVLVELVPTLASEERDALAKLLRARAGRIPPEILRQLEGIEPSESTRVAPSRLWPCGVELKDGSVFERVLFVTDGIFVSELAARKDDDPWARRIDVSDVVRVWESPHRLPAKFANRIYDALETTMGGHTFVVALTDGRRFLCDTGGVVDFPPLPDDVRPNDIVEVQPHQKDAPRCSEDFPSVVWCVFRQEAE